MLTKKRFFKGISVIKWQILFVIYTTLTICNCVEEEEPEIFLSPRNFNPHPYQAGYEAGNRRSGNRGPVLFPETPPDSTLVNANSRNLNTLSNSIHPIDRHPYASVASKHRYKQGGRWQVEDNHVNPQVYNALAAHAEKVLNKPASAIRAEYRPSLADQKKNYEFSYKVVDHLTGDDFSHTQSQNAQATNGEYRVKLPDGRLQIVSYTADKNGYKANVQYSEDDSSDSRKHNPPQSQNNLVQPINNAIKPSPILKPDQYDYIYDDLSRTNVENEIPIYEVNNIRQVPVYQIQTNVQPAQPQPANDINRNYPEYILVSTVAPPVYEISPGSTFVPHKQNPQLIYTNKFQVIPEQKLQLFDRIIDEQQKVGKFIGSTLAPYTVGSLERLQQNVVSSTLAPDLDRYTHVYINKPKFVENRQQQELYYKK